MVTRHQLFIWRSALLCFALAVIGGFIFRMTFLWPATLNLSHVRHAHSHLMAFGWIMPAFMLLIPRYLPTYKGFYFWIYSTLITGILSFFVFWRWGYSVATFGDLALPPAVIVSTLQIAAWFGYLLNYCMVTYRLSRTAPLLFFDLAFFFLSIASLGALAISIVHRFPALMIEPKLLSVWFLYLFKLGWCLTALMGILLGELGINHFKTVRLAWISLALGIPFSFLIHVEQGMIFGRLGGILFSLGLFTLLLTTVRKRHSAKHIWLPTQIYLACLALILLVINLMGWLHLIHDHSARLIFIHLLMIGGISTGLMTDAASQGYIGNRDLRFWHVAVFLLLASLSLLLVPATIICWPLLAKILAVTSIGPGLVVLYLSRPVQRQPNST